MKFTFTLLAFFTFYASFGQINFEPGYFTDNSGMKTECLIKNVAWKNNPVSFEYKLSENADVVTATIKDVSEFNVAGTYKFRRFTTDVDRSGDLADRISSKKEPEWTKETVFLKTLVEGSITLYLYQDINLIRYFYSTGDHASAVQLVYKKYKVNIVDVGENNYFRQQLYVLMGNSGMPASKFENIDYSKSDLVRLFTEYNGTTGEKTTNLSAKENKGSVHFKITAGATTSSLSAGNSGYPEDSEFDFGSKAGFRVGAEFEWVLPFNNNKWALFIDPNYQSFSADGQHGEDKWKADYKFVEVPVGVRHYMYLANGSGFFVNAACVFSASLGDSYVQRHDATPLEASAKPYLALGGGYSYKRYSAEIRYNLKHTILQDYISWESSYSSLGIILGYKIF